MPCAECMPALFPMLFLWIYRCMVLFSFFDVLVAVAPNLTLGGRGFAFFFVVGALPAAGKGVERVDGAVPSHGDAGSRHYFP